jgi:hypothetical protein
MVTGISHFFFFKIIHTKPEWSILVLVLQFQFEIPSGKRLHNHGKSPFSMGKSTIHGHFQ